MSDGYRIADEFDRNSSDEASDSTVDTQHVVAAPDVGTRSSCCQSGLFSPRVFDVASTIFVVSATVSAIYFGFQ